MGCASSTDAGEAEPADEEVELATAGGDAAEASPAIEEKSGSTLSMEVRKLRSFVTFAIDKLDAKDPDLHDSSPEDDLQELVWWAKGMAGQLRSIGAGTPQEVKTGIMEGLAPAWDLRTDRPGPELSAESLREALATLLSTVLGAAEEEEAEVTEEEVEEVAPANLASMTLQDAVTYLWDVGGVDARSGLLLGSGTPACLHACTFARTHARTHARSHRQVLPGSTPRRRRVPARGTAGCTRTPCSVPWGRVRRRQRESWPSQSLRARMPARAACSAPSRSQALRRAACNGMAASGNTSTEPGNVMVPRFERSTH